MVHCKLLLVTLLNYFAVVALLATNAKYIYPFRCVGIGTQVQEAFGARTSVT